MHSHTRRRKIILTTDSEPATWELKRPAIYMARQETAVEVVLEESNEYACQTSHFLEQEVQAVERKVRTLKFSVEEQRGDVASQSSSSCLGSGRREHGHTGEGRIRTSSWKAAQVSTVVFRREGDGNGAWQRR